jgi:hypothetical protein
LRASGLVSFPKGQVKKYVNVEAWGLMPAIPSSAYFEPEPNKRMLVLQRLVLKHLLLFSSCDVTMFLLSKSLKRVAQILRLFGSGSK